MKRILALVFVSCFQLNALGLEHLNVSAFDSKWLALTHHKQKKFSGRWISAIDDARFFLAANGNTDPKAELEASITQILGSSPENKKRQCQFPARYQWLERQINNRTPDLSHCHELSAWQEKIDAESVSLIFPAAYLDSPSSMFGHTLLRLNKSLEKDRSSLLSYSVSYAAQKSEDDSEIAFAYRGLVGGYPGDLAIVPYYHKIKEYSDIESRDIWEYQLNLSPEQVQFLMLHLWEIKDLRIDYYFFTENCSYQVMALLNVVRPNLNLTKKNPFYTIPVATVRQLYDSDLISDFKFRPSAVTKFNYHAKQLNANEKRLAKSLATKDSLSTSEVENLTPNVAAVAFEYSRLTRTRQDKARRRSLELLAAVNALPSSTLEKVPTPKFRDDQGHESERFTLAYGKFDQTNDYLELGIRPAYHDLTDPSLGYPIGSELVFSSGTLRFYENGDLELEDYTLIGIKSIKGRNLFFNPMSWSVQLGATRETNTPGRRLSPNLAGELGYGVSFSPSLLGYSLIGAELQIQNGLSKGYEILGNAKLGGIYRDASFKNQIGLELRASDAVNTGSDFSYSVKANYVYNLNRNFGFELKINRTKTLDNYFSDASLGIRYFY